MTVAQIFLLVLVPFVWFYFSTLICYLISLKFFIFLDSLDDSFNETKAIKPESRRSFHDFHFSDDDDEDDKKSNNKVSFLKTRRQETKALDYEGNERTLPKSPIFGDMGNGHLIAKDQKPTPKPRESRMKRSPSRKSFLKILF